MTQVFKDYPALIPAITTIVGLVLGYFFGKWDSERKRKWELEDREFTRRAEIYDKRIQEARDFIDRLDAWVEMMRKFSFSTLYFLLLEENKTEGIETYMKTLDSVLDGFSKVKDEGIGKKSSIDILNDKEMLDLYEKFQPFVFPEVNVISGVLYKINMDKIDMSAVDDLKRLSKDVMDADGLVVKMKIRLGELFQEVPHK